MFVRLPGTTDADFERAQYLASFLGAFCCLSPASIIQSVISHFSACKCTLMRRSLHHGVLCPAQQTAVVPHLRSLETIFTFLPGINFQEGMWCCLQAWSCGSCSLRRCRTPTVSMPAAAALTTAPSWRWAWSCAPLTAASISPTRQVLINDVADKTVMLVIRE